MTSFAMFGDAAAMLWGHIVQCKRDKLTQVLRFLLTAALGTTKIAQKHTQLIN